MQQLTGRIVSIVPTDGYNGSHGWVYTFDMTIQGPNAQVTGEIGSKSTPYPLAVGQEITVNAEQTQHGLKFKRQKQDGGYSGGGQRGSGQKKDVDWDKIAEGKVLCTMINAAITAGQMKCPDIRTAKYLTDVVMGKPQGGDPNPEYSDNPAPIDDGDSIPF